MKPYGQRRKSHNNIPDAHPQPKRKWTMWWKAQFTEVKSKKVERRRGKQEIQKQLREDGN